jgi:succinoglycan biosynthesis transport protein ExoP
LVRAVLLGFGCGLLAGLVMVVALDKINDQLKSFRDVQVHFKETVLGHVPHESVKGISALDLIRPDDPRHMFAESFRTVRSSILYLPMAGSRPKSLIVTSAVPGEGKSTVSANLAITLSFLGCRTLLVDGDLRRGKLHNAFGISGATGFAEVLMQRISWKEALQPTLYENLSLLPRGQNVSQPGEFFLGKVTDRFLQEVYREFEYVVIDSAPVIVADDTASLAPKIDAALFVVRFGTSSMRLTHRALQQLYNRQVNVLGLVLNDLSASAPDYEYYQYSKYVKEYSRPETV